MTSRRSGVVGLLLVILLALVGGAVAGDRFGVRAAERTAADRLQSELGVPQLPDAQIQGIPFLTQLATSTFDHVVVDAAAVPVTTTGGSVTIDRLHLDLRQVRTRDAYRRARAGSVTGSADLGWPSVSTLAGGVPLVYAGPDPAGRGTVRLTVSRKIFGRDVQAQVTARPELDVATQTIVFRDSSTRVFGVSIPQELADPVLNGFLTPIPVGAPLGLSASGLTVTETGARLDLDGEDVELGGP